MRQGVGTMIVGIIVILSVIGLAFLIEGARAWISSRQAWDFELPSRAGSPDEPETARTEPAARR
jgi:hypothetical protein